MKNCIACGSINFDNENDICPDCELWTSNLDKLGFTHSEFNPNYEYYYFSEYVPNAEKIVFVAWNNDESDITNQPEIINDETEMILNYLLEDHKFFGSNEQVKQTIRSIEFDRILSKEEDLFFQQHKEIFEKAIAYTHKNDFDIRREFTLAIASIKWHKKYGEPMPINVERLTILCCRDDLIKGIIEEM
ncbi:hypothetical protein [Wohlfahrtiimonas chitiniclastica]|uniref:hypothetical protein n=1 Tax=Wohlfahrtiimonas chitiniclastica TaxID=400946 RepID=UPI001BCC27CA|nr:hypothetical protein [Wohlfahrtiimonas chitiniclastica]MBS7838308.1 hypothetical protein [Wohlfahrtiimonas chitiniclastica]